MKILLGRTVTHSLVVLFAALVAGNTMASGQAQAASPAPASEGQKASAGPPVQFLIDSAAKDFHDHHPPDPARFRHVRVGHGAAPDGTRQYRLCGEFLPRPEGGKAEWTPFVTIKTSGYEQWLGGQAASFCKPSNLTWDSEDLSSRLQQRFEAMK